MILICVLCYMNGNLQHVTLIKEHTKLETIKYQNKRKP